MMTIIMNNNHNNYDVNEDNISNQTFSYIVIENDDWVSAFSLSAFLYFFLFRLIRLNSTVM